MNKGFLRQMKTVFQKKKSTDQYPMPINAKFSTKDQQIEYNYVEEYAIMRLILQKC